MNHWFKDGGRPFDTVSDMDMKIEHLLVYLIYRIEYSLKIYVMFIDCFECELELCFFFI